MKSKNFDQETHQAEFHDNYNHMIHSDRTYLKSTTLFNKVLMICLTIGILLPGCTQITDVKTIRLAHSMSTIHPVHLGMVKMSELVEQKSQGKLKVTVYPN